jgi:hypothetical protein
MLNNYRRFYKAEGKGINRVEVSIYYSKGGINYFTYKNEPRGYYFSIGADKRTVRGGIETVEFSFHQAMKGVKDCILPCERQSKKRYEEAKAQIDGLIDRYLMDWCKRNDITITDYEYTVEEYDGINR